MNWSKDVTKNTSLCDKLLLFIERYQPGLPAIVFVHRKLECQSIAENFNELFIDRGDDLRADWVTGDKTEEERAVIGERMREGKLSIVFATSCWESGIDIPGLKSVIIATGGSAPIAAKQRPGRGTRLSEDKHEFVIYDLNIGGAESQRKRQQHYQDGGYDVDAPAPAPRAPLPHDADLDVILRAGARRSAPTREQAPRKLDAQQDEEERQPWKADVKEIAQFIIRPMPLPRALTHNLWINIIGGAVLGVYLLHVLCQ